MEIRQTQEPLVYEHRHHAMILFRFVVSKDEKPRFNQRKIELYRQNILDVLNDDYKCEKTIKGIVDFILCICIFHIL